MIHRAALGAGSETSQCRVLSGSPHKALSRAPAKPLRLRRAPNNPVTLKSHLLRCVHALGPNTHLLQPERCTHKSITAKLIAAIN